MALLTFDLNQLQKVEYKNDANKCTVSFTNYGGTGKTLLITDVPAAAGSMLAGSGLVFLIPGIPTPPVVAVDFQTPVSTGDPNVDTAKYNGRLELRDFV